MSLINDKFMFSDAEKLNTVASNFFEAGHKMILFSSLNNTECNIDNFEDFSQLYEKEKLEVIKGLKDEKEYKDLISSLDNNKQNRVIREKIIENPDQVLNVLTDKPETYFKLIDYNDTITNVNVEELKKLRETITTKYNPDRDNFKETMSNFNKKFSNNFKIEVVETIDSNLGIELPEIKLVLHNQDISNNKGMVKDILSSGELNALAMLQLFVLINNNKEVKKLILIDDNHEVFDYAFKHGFIEYIIELMEDENNKIIILSHNYDFLKTLNSRTGSLFGKDIDILEYYTAYSNEDQIIKINKVKRLPNFNLNHKINNNVMLISHIPFARNIIEFISGQDNDAYKKFTDFLHYKESTLNLNLEGLLNLYKDINMDINMDISYENINLKQKYLECLFNECDIIANDYSKNCILDINRKVVMSIGIRMKFEEKFLHRIDSTEIKNNQTREIFESLNHDDKNEYREVLIITPEYIHLNAFECAPLADVTLDRFIKLYKKL